MRLRIEPYKAGSKSAKALSKRCGILRTKTGRVYRPTDTLINWGNSERRFHNAQYINNPESVFLASDKLATYQVLKEAGNVPIPDFTTSRAECIEWLEAGYSVLARSVLRGSQGVGITVLTPGAGGDAGMPHIPNVPLYVEYIKKAREYRVHVVRDHIIDIQQKRKRAGVPNEEVNYQVRNAQFGWVFCRDNVVCHDDVKNAAVDSVHALGLDFGAVDIGWNEHDGAATVYEVNTAPGLEGTTLEKYYAAMETLFPQIHTGAYATRRATAA